jgi:zinc protease
MAWKTPKLRDVNKDRDPYALDVLAAVLDGHDASHFAKNLVRGSRVAQSAGAGYDGTLRGEASFTLDGQPADGKTIADLEAALRAESSASRTRAFGEELRVRQSIAAQIHAFADGAPPSAAPKRRPLARHRPPLEKPRA